MFKPDFNEFQRLSEKGTKHVPVFREFLADMETPVSALSAFADEENVFLLESVEGGERIGRYSFLGVDPYAIFTVEHGKAFLSDRDGNKTELPAPEGKPFFALRELMKQHPTARPEGLPPLSGGAIGCMNYEIAGEFEKLPAPKTDPGTPDAMFLMTGEMIVFDNLRHTVMIIVEVKPGEDPEADYAAAGKRIMELYGKMIQRREHPFSDTPSEIVLKPTISKEQFCAMVERAREYIRQGDIIQVVPSQKFTAKENVDPVNVYRALRLINPSPYLFFLKSSERMLIGSSPETMVKLTDGTASIRPIAGTRKRGLTRQEDAALADELLSDEKERAEHLMLVDLGRNDLGRLAEPGSVQLKSFMEVQRYSHVMHLVSDIDAMLRPEYDAFDLAAAAFPAGTLSGAPKIRAMEIIHELEPEARGAYGGAVGYFSNSGNMDLAIVIRTLEINRGTLTLQAGAGIVADSVPEKEYEETLNKGAAVMKALRQPII
ncbi:MAG: anthranilate synthase component I family protein [Lentisphaeria bacterium]|nr:anthranilate synthase component I family protein [Lentisphaeria bacterium]